jgi:hypothetical protein
MVGLPWMTVEQGLANPGLHLAYRICILFVEFCPQHPHAEERKKERKNKIQLQIIDTQEFSFIGLSEYQGR